MIPALSIEDKVAKWRKKYVESALHGMPPHITLLFPFKNPKEINTEVINKLKTIFSKITPFSYSLIGINTFPSVIFMEPLEKERFIKLTKKLLKMFPDTSLYGNEFSGINPHLTIARIDNRKEFNHVKMLISKSLESKLPINMASKEAWLMEKKDGEWLIKQKFSFSR